MVDLNIGMSNKPSDGWFVVVNTGDDFVLPDGFLLKHLDSRLLKGVDLPPERFIIFNLGDSLDVSPDIAQYCRTNWTPVYDLFHMDDFLGADFYRSPKVKIGDFTLNLWYCGPDFGCRIHNEHDFFEIHTQVMGVGEMQKFKKNDDSTVYERVILSAGQTHYPFFDKNCKYPWHQYRSQTACIWLAIECSYDMFKK